MAKRRINVNNVKIDEIDRNLISDYLTPEDLAIVIRMEDWSEYTDILFDNMLHYYLETEEYLYCAVIRDEIASRQLVRLQ